MRVPKILLPPAPYPTKFSSIPLPDGSLRAVSATRPCPVPFPQPQHEMTARRRQQEHGDGSEKLPCGIVTHPHLEFAWHGKEIEPQKTEWAVNEKRDDGAPAEKDQPGLTAIYTTSDQRKYPGQIISVNSSRR